MRSTVLGRIKFGFHRMTKEEKCLEELADAQEKAQSYSYRASAQNVVVEMLKSQLEIQPMACKHFPPEYLDYINKSFDEIRSRIVEAEQQLELCSEQVMQAQARVRELVLLKDDMDKKKTKLYRKMDWYERLLPIEGIDNETISNGIAPFTQNLGLFLELTSQNPFSPLPLEFKSLHLLRLKT